MTPTAVREAAQAAGRHLVGPPIHITVDVPDWRTVHIARGVYLAYARDASLNYVGKVDRAGGTVTARITEHLRTSRRRRDVWRSVWVVPLDADMLTADLLGLERSLIRRHRPPGNVQHAGPA